MPTQLELSEQLHASVRVFSERFARAEAGVEVPEFEPLALRIAAYQRRYNPKYERLVRSRNDEALLQPEHVPDIVPVPADVFRYTSPYTFEAESAVIRFQTSGTTGSESGQHYLRTTRTYTELLLRGAHRVFPSVSASAPLVVALAPWGGARPSSLGFMMRRFMEQFDGRRLSRERSSAGFELGCRERWLISERGVDVDGFDRVCQLAQTLNAPVWVLATSFGLVQLFDACGAQCWELPGGSVVMQTGGFKGRTRELAPEEILGLVRKHLCPTYVVNEYGMTELCSQLYRLIDTRSESNQQEQLFYEPPWLRVIPRDPVTLHPVPVGEVGLANFVDLGNVDSAVSVLTQDLVRRTKGAIQLLGRNPGAPLRGCSLSIEELVQSGH